MDRRPDHGGLAGITALELATDRHITKVTSVYDSRQLSPARRAGLAVASIGQQNMPRTFTADFSFPLSAQNTHIWRSAPL